MNILRLSTLSLILATAVITLGYVDFASAGKPKCPGSHPKCNNDDNEEPPVTSGEYTAALTSGGFIFSPEAVTPNSQGNSLYSDSEDSVMMSRGSENIAWGVVFAGCAGLLSKVTGSTDTFTVKGENWHINGGAGSEIRIRFKDVDFDTKVVDIDLDLIGDKGTNESGNPVPVLPVCGTPSNFTLDRFSIFGQAKKGLKAPSCSEQGFLQVDSVLRIERTDC